jgi:hypothetical protein
MFARFRTRGRPPSTCSFLTAVLNRENLRAASANVAVFEVL